MRFAIATLAPVVALFAASLPDARDLMRRSAETRERNTEIARDYVSRQNFGAEFHLPER